MTSLSPFRLKSPMVVSAPTHRSVSEDSWPTVLGIVPVSELLNKDLQNQQQALLFRPTQTHAGLQLTVAEATTAVPRCSESCRSVDCCSHNCKVDENNSNLSVHTTNTSPILASFTTHRSVSDDSWLTVLGIVPVSLLPSNDLQNRQTMAISLVRPPIVASVPTHSC
jgi:hypothetical protein